MSSRARKRMAPSVSGGLTPHTRRHRSQVEQNSTSAYGESSVDGGDEDVENGQEDVDEDAEGEDADGFEETELDYTPVTVQRRGRGRPKGSTNKKKAVEMEDDSDNEGSDDQRARKRMAYNGDSTGDLVADGDLPALVTPRKRGRPPKRSADDGDDKDDASYKKEKIGSGRGGFSVKGAAAAAARARWEKVRKERLERGEDVDTPKRRSAGGSVKKHAIGPSADYEMGSTVVIKSEEYKVGDDELVLPDDPKGDTKVDAEGRLLGDRKYKLITFTSAERRNPERIYALTIDAARACGYSDSLAFLRRYPTILKLSCTAAERVKLIDLGRISGNLKHRQVTMVAIRNVYKATGAKVINNGKYVIDDYYEDDAAAKCLEDGIEPGSLVQDEEIAVTTLANDRPTRSLGDSSRSLANLTTFYTVGGPTTHFATSSGLDPWTDSGYGNKRSRLRTAGVSEEDWMLRTAEETRAIDGQLKAYRDERLTMLEGVDGTRGWVWALEKDTNVRTKVEDTNGNYDARTSIERKKSGLSHQVVMEDMERHSNSAEDENEYSMRERASMSGEGIIVQQPGSLSSKYNWGLGESWEPGVIRASYEPHTNLPHIPLCTQPNTSTSTQLSPYPILTYSGTNQYIHSYPSSTGHNVRGLASIEYALETGAGDELQRRLKQVQEAEEWEGRMISQISLF
nr:chromatin structure-remodeling complex protein RSC7 [Cryptococcus depauperatus CBS 7855]